MHASILIPLLFGAQTLGQGLVTRNFPHLIVPISKISPDSPQGTKKQFDIERDIWTETSFDVPNNDATFCGLSLTINTDPSRGAPWQLWGAEPYKFNVSSLTPKIDQYKDTFNIRPAPIEWVASIEVTRDGGVKQTGGMWFSCAKGQVAQFLLTPADLGRDGGVTWYELDDPLHGLTYNMYA